MTDNLFRLALQRKNPGRPPVWFMRQAGRYHSHYQALRRHHGFVDLCKRPEVAREATMGPIRDFGFDAAILFSDLLFPLEAMGMGLRYEEGPKLDWHLRSPQDLDRLQGGAELAGQLSFQAEALRRIRSELPLDKGLLGFVGGPLTLFFYACEGSHQGDLQGAREGLRDGRFEGFCEKLLDLLAENMALQARAGADCVAILDTCGGEIDPSTYASRVVPALRALLERYQRRSVDVPVLYYSKGTTPEYWQALRSLPIQGLGIDWRQNLPMALQEFGPQWAIQGNFDPHALLLPERELEPKIRAFLSEMSVLPPELRSGWICGLGHGILPKTPEPNVRLFLRLQREYFS